MRSRLIDVGLALGYAGLIFFLSSQSSFPVPRGIFSFDKVIHLVEYAVLALLVARALRPWPHAAFGAIVLATLYGVSDEFHQSFVPGRSSDPYDAIADGLGALLGAAAFTFHSRRGLRVKRGT